MDAIENIVTEEAVTTTEEIVEATSKVDGLKIFGGTVAVAGLCYAGYRLVKILIAKKKAKDEEAELVTAEEAFDARKEQIQEAVEE